MTRLPRLNLVGLPWWERQNPSRGCKTSRASIILKGVGVDVRFRRKWRKCKIARAAHRHWVGGTPQALAQVLDPTNPRSASRGGRQIAVEDGENRLAKEPYLYGTTRVKKLIIANYLQPTPACHRRTVPVSPSVFTSPRLTRHHCRAAPGATAMVGRGVAETRLARLVSFRGRELQRRTPHDHHLSVSRQATAP